MKYLDLHLLKIKVIFMRKQHVKTGTYPNIKYYTNNKLKYVGQYIRDYRTNTGDGDVENRVDYRYEGNSCFIELAF